VLSSEGKIAWACFSSVLTGEPLLRSRRGLAVQALPALSLATVTLNKRRLRLPVAGRLVELRAVFADVEYAYGNDPAGPPAGVVLGARTFLELLAASACGSWSRNNTSRMNIAMHRSVSMDEYGFPLNSM